MLTTNFLSLFRSFFKNPFFFSHYLSTKGRFQEKLFVYGFLLFTLLISTSQIAAQPGVNKQLALQYYQAGDFEKAASLYKDIYKKTPSSFYYNYYLNSLFGLQDYATAEKFIKSLIKKYPKEIKYRVELGYVYELAGNSKKSEKIYKKTLKNIPKSRGDYVAASNAFQNREHFGYAEQILNKGKNKFTPPLNVELADLYFAQGKYNKMMDSYLEMALEDYSSYVNEWLIQQQWVGLQGLELDNNSFFNAFATKSNDFMRSFTYAYSNT